MQTPISQKALEVLSQKAPRIYATLAPYIPLGPPSPGQLAVVLDLPEDVRAVLFEPPATSGEISQ